MSALPPEIEPTLIEAEAHDGYQRLWRAALANLIGDACACWLGKLYQPGAVGHDLQEAFDDLLECGPITQRFADRCGMDAEYLSRAFICWCDRN